MNREAQKYYIQSKFGVDRSLLDRIERVAESCRTPVQIKVAKRYACLAAKKIIADTEIEKFDCLNFPENKYIEFCDKYMELLKDLFGQEIKCVNDRAWNFVAYKRHPKSA